MTVNSFQKCCTLHWCNAHNPMPKADTHCHAVCVCVLFFCFSFVLAHLSCNTAAILHSTCTHVLASLLFHESISPTHTTQHAYIKAVILYRTGPCVSTYRQKGSRDSRVSLVGRAVNSGSVWISLFITMRR